MKQQYLIIAFLVIGLACGSCNKFVDVPAPKDRLVAGTVFTDDATATAAVLGIYSRLGETTLPFSAGATTIYTGLTSDELVYTGTDITAQQFYKNSLSPGNGIVTTNFWRNAYEIIYQANACIEGLSDNGAITPALRSQLQGESYFIRAFCYWYLTNLFGDVPLITHTADYEGNARLPRAPVASVQDNVIADLKEAISSLTTSYPSAGKVRINRSTATAFLARAYLYRKSWPEAAAAATEVIGSGNYSLEQDLNSVFLASSNETIWEVSCDQAGFNTVEGYRLIPNTFFAAPPQFIVSPALLNAFTTGDNRKTSWIGTRTLNGTNYYYPYKYKVRYNATKTENLVMIRLAELYLIRAEARAQLGDLTGARGDLDAVRLRAGLNATPAADKPSIISAILNERRIELFCEWGHRWFDLKRTLTIDATLGAAKTGWKPEAALFPIPSYEIQTNNSLTQNPGYN